MRGGAKSWRYDECDSADAESLEVGDEVYDRGDERGVFSADAEGLSMSIIMTLIPLFGSKSGRFKGGCPDGTIDGPRIDLSSGNPLCRKPFEDPGVVPCPVQSCFCSPFFMPPVPCDTCAGVSLEGQSSLFPH